MTLPKRRDRTKLPSRSDGRTDKVLEMIKTILRTIWNRRYIEQYIDREAKECYLLVRKQAHRVYGDASIPSCYKIIATVREHCAENRNKSFCQACQTDWIFE